MSGLNAAFICAVAFAASIPAAVDARLAVELEASATEISIGDPIFLKVTLRNGSNRSVTLRRPLARMLGGLDIQYRPAATVEYTSVGPETFIEVEGVPTTVAAGRIYTAYEVFHQGPDDLAFQSSGLYEIRTVVVVDTGANVERVQSPPLRVTVSDATDARLGVIEDARPLLAQAISAYLLSPIQPAAVGELEERLPESVLRDTLHWVRLVQEMRVARRPDERDQAAAQLLAIAAASDRITADVIELMVAMLYENNDWESAMRVLNLRLREPNYFWDRLRRNVRAKAVSTQ